MASVPTMGRSEAAEVAFPFLTGQAPVRLRLGCPVARLAVLRPILRLPRHSVPRQGTATFLRTHTKVKRRGRWGSGNIDRRYKKPGLVARRLHELPLPVRAAAITGTARLVVEFKPPSTAPFPSEGLVSFDRRCS